MFNEKKSFYCAFCKSPRKAFLRKNVTFVEILFCIVASSLVSLMFWQTIDLRLVAVLFIFLGFAEVFLQIKWRLSVVCPYCGFDPVLFKSDKDKAAQRIKIHMERRKRNPQVLLSKNAVLNIPRPPKPPPPSNSKITKPKSGKNLDISL